MNIFVYMNDCIISIIILGIIFFGTKLVNYYYNFYHIYNYLDYEQKLGYFKSTNLINLISKYPIVKKIIVYYFLIPIIKLNYLFISTFITLLYSLCYFEFKKILKEQKQKKYKHKKNKKKTYNYILSETSNDSIKDLNNLMDDSNLVVNENNLDVDVDVDIKSTTLDNTDQDIILKNDILNVDKIDTDYNNGILNIIEFTKETNNNDNNFMTIFEKLNENNEDNKDNNDKENKSNIYLASNMDEQKLENTKNKYNLLNEIDLLKKPDIDENINYYLNDSLNINNKKDTNNIDNIFNSKFLLNDLNDLNNENENNNENNNENENENENDNDISEYLIIDNKIKNTKNERIKMIDNETNKTNEINDTNETINYDDIDFGVKIEELNITNIKQNTLLTIPIEKKVIKIGKKKNKQ